MPTINPKIRYCIILVMLLIFGSTTYLLFTFGSGKELVGLRNSLIAEVGSADDFLWTPDIFPGGFLLDQTYPPINLETDVQIVLNDSQDSSNFEKALLLAAHISQGERPYEGGIRSNTVETYRAIMTSQKGYCSDYTQVMNGLAYTAKLPMREWGMSFKEFSGDGHAFNEVYDTKYNKWVFIDTFYSFYVENKETLEPLSAMEFQIVLHAPNPLQKINIVPIVESYFSFGTSEKTIKYYKRGADQFYLYMGNNVFSIDNHWFLKFVGTFSRSVEQLSSIALGIHPKIRIVPTETNGQHIDRLFYKRNVFITLCIFIIALTVTLAYLIHREIAVRKMMK